MSTNPATLILAGIVSGVAATAATLAVTSPGEGAAATSSAASAQELDAVRRLVQTVQEDQQELARRLQALQLEVLTGAQVGQDDVTIEPLAASHQELAQLRAEVAALTERVPASDDNPFMIETVSDALQAIRDQEDAERREEWAARQEQRNADRLAELTEELGLDSYQQEQMKQHMTSYDEQREAIMEAARESGDFGGLRDSFGNLRDEMQTSLGNFLTPSQLTAMEEMGGRRGGFGGGGRGGPGGGF